MDEGKACLVERKALPIENCEAHSATNSGHGPQLTTGGLGMLVPVHPAQFGPVQHFTPMPKEPPRPYYGTCYRYIYVSKQGIWRTIV